MSMKKFPSTIRAGAVRIRVYKSKSTRHKSGHKFIVAWHDGERRVTKTFGDPRDAEAFARLTADNLQAGRTGGALSSADLDLLTTVRKLAGDVGPVEALAQWQRAVDLTRGNLIEVCKAWARDHAGEFKRVSLADAVARFKRAKARQGVDVAKGYKNRLERFLAAFPGMDIVSVTTPMLNKYLERIEHPVSRNTHRRNIVTLFKWARDQGYLPESTRTAADRTDRAKENDRSDIGILTPSEGADVLRFVAVRHPEYLAPTALAIFTGMRRGEVHTQTWADIDLQAGTLHVSDAKPRTPADRLVEIPPACVEWLLRCPERTGPLCKNLAIDRVRKHAIAAGMELPENCFRHSAITYRMAAGHSAGQAAAWAGTSERQIHRHYRRPRPRAEGEQWFSLTPQAVLGDDSAKVVTISGGAA